MNKVNLEKVKKVSEEVSKEIKEVKEEIKINELKFDSLSEKQKISIAMCIVRWLEMKLPEGFESLEIVKHSGSMKEEREEFILEKKKKAS
jgi:hypothetical protein